MKRFSIIYVFFLLMITFSCTKEKRSFGVSFQTSVEQSAISKAIVTGESLPTGSSMGVFVYHAEIKDSPMTNFSDYGEKYTNIKGDRNSAGKWEYTLRGGGTPFQNFFLIEPTIEGGTGALAICAYSPYTQEATSIKNIPFTLGGNHSKLTDLMWAEQNRNSDNLYIRPEGGTKEIPLTFKHALSMLVLDFKCQNEGTIMTISSIRIKKNGTTPLYLSGEFNAVDGTFPSLVPVGEDGLLFSLENDNFTFNHSGLINNKYESFGGIPLLIVPVDNYQNDGDYVIEFTFNGQMLATKYAIRVNDIIKEGTSKFAQGYTYKFKFVFDNYAQIKNIGVSVDEIWGSDNYEMVF